MSSRNRYLRQGQSAAVHVGHIASDKLAVKGSRSPSPPTNFEAYCFHSSITRPSRSRAFWPPNKTRPQKRLFQSISPPKSKIDHEAAPDTQQRPIPRPPVEPPPRPVESMPILLGQIVQMTAGEQDVKDGIKTAPVIALWPSHNT